MLVDVEALEVLRPIGYGGQATVWLARDPSRRSPFGWPILFAVKQVHKPQLTMSGVYKHVTRVLVEREALRATSNHPFISTCYTSFQNRDSLFFVLDYGALDLFVLTSGPGDSQRALPHTQARFYAACVALALKHMHALGWAYRDLK